MRQNTLSRSNSPRLLRPALSAALAAAVALVMASAGLGQSPSSIGPDAFGYSAAGVSAAFENVAGTAGAVAVLTSDSNAFTAVPLPFPFRFYGQPYSGAFVSTNGLLTFGAGTSQWQNQNLNTGGPDNDAPAIAVLWDNWVTTGGFDAVWYAARGTAPSRRFIVQWNQMGATGGSGPNAKVTFQAVLYEGTNEIDMVYLDSYTGQASNSNGASATVGIRDAGGQSSGRRLQWSFNQGVITSGTALRFSHPVNSPPTLASIGPKTVSEEQNLSFTLSASDTPGTILTYSASLLPSGALLNASTGAFTWTPTEAQGPGVYTVVFTVTDNGTPALSDSETVQITVLEVNSPPVLAAIPAQTVHEANTRGASPTVVSFTALASDAESGVGALAYSLVGAPDDAAIDPGTGFFTWSPAEKDGPSVVTFQVKVTDGGSPAQTDTEQVTITVKEVNEPPVATIDSASANASTVAGDPCTAAPDQLAAAGAISDPDLPANNLTYRWLVDGAASSQTPLPTASPSGPVPALSEAPAHQAHHQYLLVLEVSDNFDAGQPNHVGQAHTDEDSAAKTVQNLPPVVFGLRWHRSADPCAEVTDTPSAAGYTAQKSLVAVAVGEENAPGAFLNVTAAACDPDGDALRFTFHSDWDGSVPAQATGGGPGTQAVKLSEAALLDGAVHPLKVVVSDEPWSAGPPQAETPFAPVTVETAPVRIADPREQLRKELAGLGFSSVAAFHSYLEPKLAAAQADLEGAALKAGFPLPNGLVVRQDEWALSGHNPLAASARSRAGYFALLMNVTDQRLPGDTHADLNAPIPAGVPRFYLDQPLQAGLTRGVDYAFPIQNIQEFLLPDHLFLKEHGLTMLRGNTLATLGFVPPSGTPPTALQLARSVSDHHDLAALFNDRGAELVSGGTLPATHKPRDPRVRVLADVNDGLTLPSVCWSLDDAFPGHTSFQVSVYVDGTDQGALPANTQTFALPVLASGPHSVRVKVTDTAGFSAERTVWFWMP